MQEHAIAAPPNEAMRRLDLRLPVVQGPFGGGFSSVALAAAVSQGGGLGSFGAHMLAPDAIAAVVADLRAQTSARFAINLWVSGEYEDAQAEDPAEFERAWTVFAPWFDELGLDKPQPQPHYRPVFAEQMDALLEARPPAFSFVFGVPDTKILATCRARDIVTIGAATSIAEARAIEAAGIDMVVASGFEAGGHRPSFLAPAEESLMGTFALTQLLSARVSIPVIAAGGITDARGVRAALMLGAQAAQIGTAFLACAESGTNDAHRAALFGEGAEHTTLTRAFSGRLARGLRNGWTDAWRAQGERIAPYPLQGWFAGQLRAAALAAGRTDLISLWSSQIAPNLRHRHVADLLQALRDGLADIARPA